MLNPIEAHRLEQLNALTRALEQLAATVDDALIEIEKDELSCKLNEFGIVQSLGNQVDRLVGEFVATKKLLDIIEKASTGTPF